MLSFVPSRSAGFPGAVAWEVAYLLQYEDGTTVVLEKELRWTTSGFLPVESQWRLGSRDCEKSRATCLEYFETDLRDGTGIK